MNLSGCHFVYADTSSRSYKLWFAHCDTSEYLPINGTTESVTVFNARGNRKYLISDSYEDSAITFEAEIMTDDASPMRIQQLREAERWLFGRKNYYRLYVDMTDDCEHESHIVTDGELKSFYLNCRFINPEKILGNGGVIGWKVNVECDSCLAWEDATEKTFLSPAADSPLTIEVDSDMNEYIYPKITIQMGGAGSDVSIVNLTDDSTRVCSFKSLTGDSSVTMNGEVNYISGDNYTKFLNRNFVRLLPGANSLSVTGDIESIVFEWSNRRYL